MSDNFVDSTTIHAVDSLFRRSHVDPYARTLAGKLADLFIYSEQIRYPIPIRGPGSEHDLLVTDSLLRDMASRDSAIIRGERYSTAEPRAVADDLLAPAFNSFASWATSHAYTIHDWLTFHHEPWIQEHRKATTAAQYTFHIEELKKTPELLSLASAISVPDEDLIYAFDSVLKYPLFGELTGAENYYLNHPIREAFLPPQMSLQSGIPPQLPISWAATISAAAPDLTRDEYAVLLHELRGAVRYHRVHERPSGDVDPEVLRDVAVAVRLPPQLSHKVKKAGIIGGGVLAVAGAFSLLTLPATVVGAAVAVASEFWKIPRTAASIKWLRWALRWEIEDQAKPR